MQGETPNWRLNAGRGPSRNGRIELLCRAIGDIEAGRVNTNLDKAAYY